MNPDHPATPELFFKCDSPWPAAGGGVYGERFATSSRGIDDHRCAFRAEAYCSSNREQNDIIDNLIEVLPELKQVSDKIDLTTRIRKIRLGGLIEFSRAVYCRTGSTR